MKLSTVKALKEWASVGTDPDGNLINWKGFWERQISEWSFD